MSIHLAATRKLSTRLSTRERGLLFFLWIGAQPTNLSRGKWVVGQAPYCECGMLDTLEHRWFDCTLQHRSDARTGAGVDLQRLGQLSLAQRVYGFVPRRRRMSVDLGPEMRSGRLPCLPDHLPPACTVYTDGSCSDPAQPEVSLAGWGFALDLDGNWVEFTDLSLG